MPKTKAPKTFDGTMFSRAWTFGRLTTTEAERVLADHGLPINPGEWDSKQLTQASMLLDQAVLQKRAKLAAAHSKNQ